QKLFETQKILDDKIVKEKGLDGVDLLDKKILALQVELGELANEWRGFKFWSEDQDPRTVMYKNIAMKKVKKNPLLEEYVDCLHFILSIGNDLGVEVSKLDLLETCSHQDITSVFSELMIMMPDCLLGHGQYDVESAHEIYEICLANFIQLGSMLGFTWEQIEQAYYDKNKVNHERQNNGY